MPPPPRGSSSNSPTVEWAPPRLLRRRHTAKMTAATKTRTTRTTPTAIPAIAPVDSPLLPVPMFCESPVEVPVGTSEVVVLDVVVVLPERELLLPDSELLLTVVVGRLLEEVDDVTVVGGTGGEEELVGLGGVLVSGRLLLVEGFSAELVVLVGSGFGALEVVGAGTAPPPPPVILKWKLYWKMLVSDWRVMMMPYVASVASEGTVQLYEPAEPSTPATTQRSANEALQPTCSPVLSYSRWSQRRSRSQYSLRQEGRG